MISTPSIYHVGESMPTLVFAIILTGPPERAKVCREGRLGRIALSGSTSSKTLLERRISITGGSYDSHHSKEYSGTE